MQTDEAKWKPLSGVQRRIVGVLVEKAKTTPDQYPLSLNGLTTGCNQKSNRSPTMSVAADDVQVELDELRNIGAVVEVQSGGRVAKFKHLMYEWLGVDKLELAVMAELLLRGEQSVGELRGRAARMESIPDLQVLQPVLSSLVEKGLVIELTPAGRGQVITHALLSPPELQAARSRASTVSTTGAPPAAKSTAPVAAPAPAPAADSGISKVVADLQRQVADLTQRVQTLESRSGPDGSA